MGRHIMTSNRTIFCFHMFMISFFVLKMVKMSKWIWPKLHQNKIVRLFLDLVPHPFQQWARLAISRPHVLNNEYYSRPHNTAREQPPRICKNNKSKINCESAIGQHLIANPKCAKTYTDDNFRIIGQARSSFHLSVLESVYIKTQNPVLCRQKEFVFSLGLFK